MPVLCTHIVVLSPPSAHPPAIDRWPDAGYSEQGRQAEALVLGAQADQPDTQPVAQPVARRR